MNKAIILAMGLTALIFTGCNNTPPAVQQTNTNAQVPGRTGNAEPMISHSTEERGYPTHGNSSSSANNSKSQPQSKWAQGGEAIDTTKFDAEIAKAEKDLKAKPADGAAKKALAESYFNRAVALTDARQYASALGDYRKCVKNDPDHEQAKSWVSQITMIYQSMKKDVPEEGKEPQPLPFKK